jgi:CTP synthase
MQLAVVEAARKLAGIEGASSTEFGPTEEPVVGLLTEWERHGTIETRAAGGDLGGTMRLGTYPCVLEPGSLVHAVYEQDEISERHRHRYEVNNAYRNRLSDGGMVVSGHNPELNLVEMIELSDHPYFVGCQFHPEFKSKPFAPHPLFSGFIRAALEHRDGGRR